MEMKWTAEQEQVIKLRDRNILVSAAAGSGKTAVLVERIITRLTKDENPVDIDRILIVTFTEAAASEMKERISKAVEQALEADPDNEHLKKQTTLIHNAKITTIHSFCLSVIREYFHTIDLDPGFRIAEEGEIQLLKKDVLGELLEKQYEEGSEQFLDFVESFATGKEDGKLEDMILQLYEFAGSYPDMEGWLKQCPEFYKEAASGTGILIDQITERIKAYLDELDENVNTALELCQMECGPVKYLAAIESDQQIIEELKKAETFLQLEQAFSKVGNWARLGVNKKGTVDPDLVEEVKALRNGWKKQLDDLKEMFFFQPYEEMQKDLEASVPLVEMLIQLVEEFSRLFAQKKADKNMIDFHDMEHFALQILTEKKDGEFVPTEASQNYQELFDEIMIDEYQDSNYIQETILTSVSRMHRGEYNIFMVGDVKQSIYRFRLSRPEIFMDKYNHYSLTEGPCQRIDLHKNFRSREEVLEATNFIFRKIMQENMGKITYDDAAALYVGADFPEGEGKEGEILLLDLAEQKEEKVDAKEWEAKMIAARIHQLMRSHKVWDRKKEEYRPLRYSDIVILTRTISGWADVIGNVLIQEGIPAYTASKEGYFETLEVGWILDYLKILDNFRQDIPLAAVLKSPFVMLSNEELAKIRNLDHEQAFHENVIAYAENEDELAEKIRFFLEDIQLWRRKMTYTSVGDLLWEIMEESGYRSYVAAMPGGTQRLANLEMLLVKAKAFESTSYKGIFHFVRYVEQLKKYNIDFGEAGIFDESMDAVQLMSIHKSKGLEFPVVFVAGTSKSFNMQDARGQMTIHPEWGIGMDAIDLKRRTKCPTLVKKFIQLETKMETLGEELRILYVAMTRAKEKLILTGVSKKLEKELEQRNQWEILPFTIRSRAGSYLDWILPAVCGANASPFTLAVWNVEDIVEEEIEKEEEDQLDKVWYLEQILDETSLQSNQDPDFSEQIREQFEYQYGYEEKSGLKLKYSVSELKKKAFEEQIDGEALFQEEEPVLVPAFLQEAKPLTGASKGTAYHKVLELIDYSKDYEEASLKERILQFKEDGFLDSAMQEAINVQEILRFLGSDCAKRMQKAERAGLLYKEQPFVYGIPATRMNQEAPDEELVLIQGIIDVYFEEEDQIVVLDYKTDRVHAAKELKDRYAEQLKLYSEALEQMTGKKVKEQIVYSFALEKEICFEKK